ncbi:ferrous iron transport protein B [Pelotomaculum propionicicum]|uniref:ferrous iron transport protein B n=1 Tax=Pelotomaculum propionicicum TaxID=258475 RepID=UPI003B7C7793
MDKLSNEIIPAGGDKIVLAGNPNVGKSVIFNALTGLYTDVSNYPGTTLNMACGRYGSDVLIDTPGVYGVSSLSEEETVTRDIILSADTVVDVVNAVHLEQDLFLTLQIIDMGIPLIVVLNMIDDARREGIKINIPLLEKMLGVPVVSMAAESGIGLADLKRKLKSARTGNAAPSLQEKINKIHPPAGRGEALLILEGDQSISARYSMDPGTEREALYLERRERVNHIVSNVIRETGGEASFSSRLGRWMLRPATGFPLLALTLLVVYELIGVFLAGFIVDSTGELMSNYYEPAIRSLLAVFTPSGSVINTLLVGQYGVLTLTVTYLIGLLLPLVLGIFLVLSVLEDTGYLPRIATLVDRTLAGVGLNGQAVIPLILGFGCVTMAFISTRMLSSDRERRIAIFLLALCVPCSAQLAVIIAILAGQGAAYMVLYGVIIFCLLVCTGTLLSRFLPGGISPLLIELPPLRLPKIRNIMVKTWNRSYHFIIEALPIFAGGTLFLGILDVTGLLDRLRELLAPVTVNWLHLSPEVADILIMGFIRKEFGAAAIINLHMLPLQNFVILLTLSLTVPCIASTMVIFKERGWREGIIIWLSVFCLAFLIGGVATRVLEYFNRFGYLQVPVLAGLIIMATALLLAFLRLPPLRKSSNSLN